MSVLKKTKSLNQEKNLSGRDSLEDSFLVLYNDEVNSFWFVIETLIEVCNHEPEQAEQCAWITHTKGKCDVKKGPDTALKPLKSKLISKGLSATIE